MWGSVKSSTKVLKPFNVQGTLDLSFEVQGKGKIVEDRGFKCLMKTGRPELYIPSASTVSRDVKLVFARTRERIAKLLQVTRIGIYSDLLTQEYNGRLNFATDAWTSPNHRAYVAVMVHMELNGEMISLVLDVVEVAEVDHISFIAGMITRSTDLVLRQSHTGLNLALAFKSILEDFGIEHKILSVTCDNASNNDTMVTEMHERITSFNKVNRTRCFLHVLNLVAKNGEPPRTCDSSRSRGSSRSPSALPLCRGVYIVLA
ncbi:LOW QUALITY PROTEIN: hypothetical protein CVT26_001472 [Gymnopilus dilepis]|uniref:DUF659 domain-containing protein n=1 Tax=Gymnopilus dilepis TaxID=231916 RepID=A0A409YUJ3_9AGAR|nr:LOW QUALITY PROTEIN: hypothetical protein CVT26_001472 [Gymnopilus dilepis]